jgi:hypothetical protein
MDVDHQKEGEYKEGLWQNILNRYVKFVGNMG